MAGIQAPAPLANAGSNGALPVIANIPAGAPPVNKAVVGNVSKRTKRVLELDSTDAEKGQAELHLHEVTHQALGLGQLCLVLINNARSVVNIYMTMNP